MAAWTALVARRRWWAVAGAALLTILALVAIWRGLGISTNTVDMISPEVPFRQHAKAFNAAFPELNDTIVAVIDAPTPERADDVAESLTARLRGSDDVKDIYLPGDDFLRRHGLLYLKPDALGDLVDRLAEAEPLLAELARNPNLNGLAEVLTLAAERGGEGSLAGLDRLLDEMSVSAQAMADDRQRSLSWQALLSPSEDASDSAFGRTRRFVIVHPRLDFTKLKPASAAIAEVRTVSERLEVRSKGAVSVSLTGEAVIEHQEMETVEAGGSLAALLSLVAVATILLLGLRAPRLVAASLITLIAGLVWTAGLAAVVVGQLNLISVAFAVLFLGLGIDFCIHYALRYREEGRSDVPTAIVTAGRGVGCALLLSALCAAVGFLSFLPTAYLGLAELGLIAGLGMFVAVFASLTLLPALIALWRPRRGHSEAGTTVGRQQAMLLRNRRPVLFGAGIVGIVAAVIAPTVQFDFNPMNLRDPEASSIQTFEQLAADVETTPYVVNVLAEDVAGAEGLAERFKADPAFGGARTFASFVPKDQDDKLATIADAVFFLAPVLTAPETREATSPASRRDAYERLRAAVETLAAGEETAVARTADNLRGALAALGSSPDLAALEDRWTHYLPDTLRFLREALSVGPVKAADLPDALRARWVAPDGRARVEAWPTQPITDNGDIRAFAEASLAISDRATGAPVVIHKASEAVVAAFTQATIFAALGIVVLLAVTLRRVTDMLMTLAPLVLAAVLTLATAALVGIPLNFANVIVLPLLMGLGVSSGIHLVLRARQSATTAIALVSSTPRAVLLSTLTTLASFGTLIVSDHRGMSSMGALLTIAVGFTLLSILVVLPCLLAEVDSRRGKATGAEAVV